LKSFLCVICGCVALALCAQPATAAGSEPTKRVLILIETESSLPAAIAVVSAIREAMQSKISSGVVVYEEFLDLDRFPETDQKAPMTAFLRQKYAKTHVDLVIAGGYRALDFMLERRADLFRGASLVFTAVGASVVAERHLPPDVLGIAMRTDLAPTLELALRLQPNTRQLVVVTGASYEDRSSEARARRELRPYQDRLRPIFLSGLPMAELLHEVSRLPHDTIVLYLKVYQDGAGQFFYPRDVAKKLSDASSAPVYGIYDTYLDHGIVGGYMGTFAAMGREVARLALRILAGERPTMDQLGVGGASANYVNWLQLRRWGLDESRLPPGTIVRFKEPSPWPEYRWQIVAVFGLIAIQSFLVIALLVQNRRRRNAEESVRESETRMALAAESAKLGLWHWDGSSGEFWTTDICRQIMGHASRSNPTFEQFLWRVHSDDRVTVGHAFERARAGSEPLQIEYRLTAPDGTTRWISAAGRMMSNSAGKQAHIMGVVADITRRRQAEIEAADQRAQLAHLTRVAILGELSGALAHELSQPLTAILSNAQAAQRFLAKKVPDLADVRSIMADIVSEDLRAGEVIRHLRSLFKKNPIRYERVDLNGVIVEVLKIAHSDLIARSVRVIARLRPDLASIKGDHVQLQQVFLNLLINACDAMQDKGLGDRILIIETGPAEGDDPKVSFADNGPGIAPQLLDRLFQPFVTSKQQGLGLGLSVCRSIVETHGGRLWALNNPDRGATFSILLPALSEISR
jgi:PAS domain S-box-containing protein